MSRLRVTLVSSLLVMGLAVASFQSFAQQPGGGGGRGGRGGGPGGGLGGWGGGPGGWGGGPGGPGGNLLNLLSNAAVQEEIKLKEAQKVKIKTLTEQSNQQREKIRNLMTAPAANQNGGNQGAQNGGNAADANNGNNQPQGGGRGGRGRQMDPETQERFAMMREQMGELQNYVDNAIAKILDKNQLTRVNQIQFQLDSPQNLFRDEVMEKLQITEEQHALLTEVRDENRTLQRENGQGRRELMKAAMDSLPQVQANNNGGNNGGGGRGGRGAFNDPAVREAMQKYMERPEVKAKMEQFQTADEKLQEQYINALYRLLSKRQVAIYKKLLGAPFDLSKIRGGGPGRGPWNAQNRNGAVAKGQGTAPATTNASSKTAGSSTATANSAAATNTDKPATDTANTKRKSALRAARGLDD